MIVPIPKASRMSEPGNYRPISLLCILGTLLEKYMANMICEHLEESNYELSRQQWGFRPNRSTTSALLSVTHDWHVALNKARRFLPFSLIIRRPSIVFPIALYSQSWNLCN